MSESRPSIEHIPNDVPATPAISVPATQYDLATEIVFIDPPSTGGNGDQYLSSSPPIYQTATFKQVTVSDPGEYEYTRSSNPTRSALGIFPMYSTVTCN
jgi:cysteine-S-conjugate beta-lyase